MDEATTACEDLKFFERRLTEVIGYMGPTCTRWRISVAVVIIGVVVGLTCSKWLLAKDVVKATTEKEYFWSSHIEFTICLVTGLFLFGILGVHRRVVAPSIIARRCRIVLSMFSLSCDHKGKLIVKPAMRVSAP